jgi:hypothetical protein
MSQNKDNYAAGFDTPLGRIILLAEDTITETNKNSSLYLVGLGFAGTKMNDEGRNSRSVSTAWLPRCVSPTLKN